MSRGLLARASSLSRGRFRIGVYVLAFLLLLVSYPLLRGSTWVGSTELHTLMETVATLLALLVGTMAMVRFYARKNNTFLFIGTGFVGTGLLDGYHTIVTSSIFASSFPSAPTSLIPWSWIASRLFLSVLLFLSWIAWTREAKAGESGKVGERVVYLTAGALTVSSFVFFAFVPLPRAYYPEIIFHRPEEFVPALFFLVALIGYLRKGAWRTDDFEHWLVLSLIIGFMGQAMFMSFSGRLFDIEFDAAHLLKKVSYIAVLVGLLISIFHLFRQLEMQKVELQVGIARRRRAEGALKSSEERFQRVVEDAADAIFVMDRQGRFADANQRASDSLGYSREELRGLSVEDIDLDHDPEKSAEAWARAATGVPSTVEGTHIRKDGTTFPVEVRVSSIELGGKQHLLALARDVTERKLAEQALRKSEASNRALINAIPDLMLRIRRDGVFLDHVAAKDSPGLATAPETFLGKNIVDMMPLDFALQLMDRVSDALDTGEGQTFEYQLAVPLGSGDMRDFEARVHTSGDDEVLAIVRDITERRVVERMKDEFVSVVSHELRTPLTSIRGALGLLAGGLAGPMPDRARRMFEIAVNNTDRLVRLINEILDIERMESGKAILEKSDHDAGDLMTQAAEVVQELAEEAGVTLSISPQSARLQVDPDRIVQTLTNLLSNAIKFSPRGGTVSLEAECQQQQIVFQIRDQGRGIPAEKLDSIFGRFQQVDASDSRLKGGTGLGLAICRSIVQQHDGEIWAESVEGEGSSFFFTLPALEEGRGETHVAAPGGPTVLVCDEDPTALEMVGALLRRHGYRVVTATSGEQVVTEAAARRPAAILLDLLMSEMDGYDTLAELKKRPETNSIPIIILSTLGQDRREAVRPQVAEWVSRPIDEEHLLGALCKVAGADGKPARVLVVEDDIDLAHVLVTMFQRHDIQVSHAKTSRQAIELSERLIPDLLVLDLTLSEGDGYEVVDWLRREERSSHPILVVYTASDLEGGDRQRLKLGKTQFFTKGRTTPKELEESVVGLIRRIVPNGQERYDSASEADPDNRRRGRHQASSPAQPGDDGRMESANGWLGG